MELNCRLFSGPSPVSIRCCPFANFIVLSYLSIGESPCLGTLIKYLSMFLIDSEYSNFKWVIFPFSRFMRYAQYGLLHRLYGEDFEGQHFLLCSGGGNDVDRNVHGIT